MGRDDCGGQSDGRSGITGGRLGDDVNRNRAIALQLMLGLLSLQMIGNHQNPFGLERQNALDGPLQHAPVTGNRNQLFWTTLA